MKLIQYGLSRNDIDELMTHLITEGFLNEERFAKAFAGGKFRLKKWGRLKIARELERREVSKNCVRLALKEIDAESYEQSLSSVLKKKLSEIEESNIYSRRDKAARHAILKGYEPDLVWDELRKIIPG
jgi:regulatory protein